MKFDAEPDAVWAGLAQHGRPIQYAHMPRALALWDVWTPIAGPPVACEPPSASFALDWHTLQILRSRGVAFVTITHAAGLSSTGDLLLDAHLPFDEPYHIPDATARAIQKTKARARRVVAIGTTVVRALEHSADVHSTVRAGPGIADQRIDRTTRLRVVDVILSGTHEPDTSHYQLLRAFASDDLLRKADRELNALGYRTHEFGDSVLIERQTREWRAHQRALSRTEEVLQKSAL
jgi:S-adenosylmethionine:tRNA ribosyltransferase-isomerase